MQSQETMFIFASTKLTHLPLPNSQS